MKLKEWLNKKKLTLKQFSEKSGVKYSTLYKIYNYKITPSIETAYAIKVATNNRVKFEDWIK